MQFADLIAPLTPETFQTDYFGKRPLHIPAPPGADRGALLSWERMNDLLAVRPHWTETNTRLIMNNQPVRPELYLEEMPDRPQLGRLANPAKVEVFLAMGASLVANYIEDVAPEVREVTASLADRFSARAGANVYCSFRGIQAFPSHCDLHEVFAVQCEGEKVWNIYENRAAFPVEALSGDDAQAMIDAVKGRLMTQVTMRPGDTLYIPRGYYHDALASTGASLHVTFSVAPLTGRALFRMLEEEAIRDEAFRQYLPDFRSEAGHILQERLALLADRVHTLMSSPAFVAEVGERQRRLWDPPVNTRLPNRLPLKFYARSQVRANLEKSETGTRLHSPTETIDLRQLGTAAEWMLERKGFPLEELFASFRHVSREELTELVETMERLELIFGYQPRL